MKAVLLNSADKIKDDGTVAPIGTFLGMERTVLLQHVEGQPDKNWFDTLADSRAFVPLDEQMDRPFECETSFRPIQPRRSGPGAVPLIGWDYNELGTTIFTNT